MDFIRNATLRATLRGDRAAREHASNRCDAGDALTLGPISGAHFNPAVTLADASQGGLAWRDVPGYLAAQLAGAFAGVAAAHLMFGEAIFSASRHAR